MRTPLCSAGMGRMDWARGKRRNQDQRTTTAESMTQGSQAENDSFAVKGAPGDSTGAASGADSAGLNSGIPGDQILRKRTVAQMEIEDASTSAMYGPQKL